LKKSLRTEHLNEEEKETDFRRILRYILSGRRRANLHLDPIEINTRTDSAPVNVRPYHLPERHKKEISRQIEKMLNESYNQVPANGMHQY